ncbi:complement factor B-like [Ornithodoros turicata]|uniref:complement factor B-like n=1 Tax=Ornithodoros turicata TaxID=34597 RepID=UPI003139DDC0
MNLETAALAWLVLLTLQRDAAYKNICHLPQEPGYCRGFLLQLRERWYFHAEDGRCRRFYHGDCGGNENNFGSQIECEQRCGHPDSTKQPEEEFRTDKNICHLPQEPGYCRGFRFPPRERWYFHAEDGRCKRFYYGGCRGNENNFGSHIECEQRCGHPDSTEQDEEEFRIEFCFMPSEAGPCLNTVTRWFYDNSGGVCRAFHYGGCLGNGNRFRTRQECETKCGRAQETVALAWLVLLTLQRDAAYKNICHLPQEPGYCRESRFPPRERWYFHAEDGRCKRFYYGGCRGNENNFGSHIECEQRCGHPDSTEQDEEEFRIEFCFMPSEAGPCLNTVTRWFYDKSGGVCRAFHYGGCLGNGNRFRTRRECETKCGRAQEYCTRVDFGSHIIVEEFVNSNVTEFPVDSRVYLKCEEGYMLKGASSLVCVEGGWSGKSTCQRIHCGRPSVPEFGWMKIDTSFIGDVASFGCQHGYKLIGQMKRFCRPNGVWSGFLARCVLEEGLLAQRGCESPGIPDNGRTIRRSYRPGARVTFACNPGYSLRGEDTIFCDHRGCWSHPLPTCIGKFYYDMPSVVAERLMKPLRIIQNMSGILNAPVEESRAWVLNLNEPGVRHVAYFVIDASSSMGERDFWKVVALTGAIIMKINVTQRGHRVGVVTFSNSATSVVTPHGDVSMDMVLEKLRNMSYTKGGTDLKAALAQMEKDLNTAIRSVPQSHEKLHISIFLITDGMANLGGSPKQVLTKLKRNPYHAEVYVIGVSSTPNREALEGLVSSPVDDHLFILRDYDSMQRLAEKLTNGAIDYSVCGSTQRHNIDTGKEDEHQARIAGGEDVETAWPWMVKVSISGALCGASIISRTWILTAAHCVSKGERHEVVRPEEIQIQLGLTDRRSTSSVKNIPVKSIIRHEDYNGTTLDNDIALLELQSNMTYNAYIRPICLPPEKLRCNSHFYPTKKHAFVIGWGKTGTYWYTVQKLQQVKVTIHDDATCTSAHGKYSYTDNMMCAGGYGEGDTCKGDSGGPLMQGVTKDQYIWTQVGIVSWGQGEGCKKSGKPGVYTRLSRYRPWIDQYVPDAQESP